MPYITAVSRLHHALTGAAAVLAVSAAMASSAAAQQASPDAIINIGSLYEPQNLDNTAGAGQGVSEAFNGNVYEALFRLADSGEVEPVLSESYEAREDGLTYTFKLREGVTFHSGDPLTAADVKFSIERVMAPESKSSRRNSLSTIANIEAPDDRTVVITLKQRSISLPYNLSYVWIVNDAATELTSSADGTGPYRLENWRRGTSLTLTPSDNYWGEAPRNGGVVFTYFTEATAQNNALLTGAIDIIPSVQSPDSLAMFEGNPQFTVTEGVSTTKELLAYNDRVEPFSNVKVRKALARAIDKKRLLASIWGEHGTLIGSFVPPTDPWYVDLTGVDAYDPDSARQLLEEAGLKDGFSFSLDTPNYDPHPLVAQFIQNELGKIGVKVDINLITSNEWYTKIYQAQDFQATLQEHVNHRDIVFYGNPNFYWGYDNPQVVELIASAEASATVDEQVEKLTEANKIIAEDAASNWLYLYPQIVVSSAKVSGYPVNGLNSQFFAYSIEKSR